MPSTIVTITSVTSFIGFIINLTVMFVVLFRGRKKHHYLFAPLLLIGACWDLGIFLIMIRNTYINEFPLYYAIIAIPITFFPAFVFHFTTTYVKKPYKKFTILLYAYCITSFILLMFGVFRPYEYYSYEWGNIAKFPMDPYFISYSFFYVFSLITSLWLLYRARKIEKSPLRKRHMNYIIAGLFMFCVAGIKMTVTLGVNIPWTLPLGMLLLDSFGALIGIAIVKHKLFDITVYVRKGLIYSGLAVVIVFIFEFSEHLIVEFLGKKMGEHSTYLHLISIGLVVAFFMPVKQKLDSVVGTIFKEKEIHF